METIKISGRFTNEEREVHLYLDPIDRVWVMDAFMPKYFRKAIKQGWTPIRQYVYDDGTVGGMTLTGPERAITIRSTAKKQLSDKQLDNLFDEDDE